MALALITPTGAVTQNPTGIIAVRCQDYPGPARGSLSVVTDALSVGGDVIREEQTIAVPTTTSGCQVGNQFGSVADSVRIPFADLGLHTNEWYQVFITIRTEGDPPSNSQFGSTWDRYGAASATTGGSGSVCFGDSNNAHFANIGSFARHLVPNYVMYSFGLWTWNTSSPPANFTIRAWTITGGDQATLLDMLYLIPRRKGTGSEDGWNLNDMVLEEGFDPLSLNSDDSVDPDEDNDVTSAPWLGQFSVLDWRGPWIKDGQIEMQEDDDEATSWHTNEGTWQTDPLKAYLAYVAGATHLEAVTIFDEGFPVFVKGTNWDFVDTTAWQYTADDGFVVRGQHGLAATFSATYVTAVVASGWAPNGGAFLRCYIGDDSNVGGHGYVFPGRDPVNTVLGGTLSDPQDHFPTMPINHGVIITTRCRFNETFVDEVYYGAGTFYQVGATIVSTQAELRVESDGDLTLQLNQDLGDPHGQVGGSGTGTRIMDGPTAVGSGYSLGDEWWLKVEKRGYFWRAKAWADGDSEPDWQVEGHEYAYRQNGLAFVGIAYPWDVNWGTTGTTMVYDPRNGNSQQPHIRAAIGAKPATQLTVDCLELTIENDPGSGTPGDVQTKTLRDDDSAVLDDAVTVPWGSHRWVYGPAIRRHFGSGSFDDLGFNIRVWKDSSFPDMTPAILGVVWERRLFPSLFLPQIYRLVRY